MLARPIQRSPLSLIGSLFLRFPQLVHGCVHILVADLDQHARYIVDDWVLPAAVGFLAHEPYVIHEFQLARVAIKHAEAAKKLKVKKIIVGECGHAHKALTVVADRVLQGEVNIHRESAMTLLEDIVFSGKIEFDPSKNDFPVTLHDPCNMVRLMGIVEPQRRILRHLCPQFREMTPHGVENYCCGGGSGFAIMSPYNFQDWRLSVSGRMKLKQVIEAFADHPEPETKKYLCAPCSNCKGQFRDLFAYYNVWERSGILYGGLVELIVNAMADIKEPFLEWEFH